MVVSFGQHQRRSALSHGLKHFIANKPGASLIGNQFRKQLLKLDAPIVLGDPQPMKTRRTDMDSVIEWTRRRLLPGVDSRANRSALHEDNRVMPILASDRGGEARDEFGSRLANDSIRSFSPCQCRG